jgi:phosphoserine aminotransferase
MNRASIPSQIRRTFNFNAGPGALPLPVLERVREELLDYRGTGMSVMEMSHRSPEFEDIMGGAERNLRQLMAVPDDYAILFLQGGGSMQFSMVPANLYLPGKAVDVLHTGLWTAKAIAELRRGTPFRLAASTEPQKFTRVPCGEEMELASDASYVYMCTNNTIEGTQYASLPETDAVPLVADMSSDIASRPLDVRRFGLIFAGAQKNLGPAGLTIVIIRRDLAERADKSLPSLMQYRTEIAERSLAHTPPTFAVYVCRLVLEWIEQQGGLRNMQERSEAKAKLLYDAIDASDLYSCPVERGSRSRMNVVFRVGGGKEAVEKRFASDAAAAGIAGITGHRSVGGMRVSLYNAVTIEAVEALVAFMGDFARTRA